MHVSMRWVFVSIMLSSVAFAQPGEPEPPPEPPPMAQVAPAPDPMIAPAPPAPTVPRGIVEDANAGRGWVMPTALTEPAGTWSFSDFELLMISIGYSVTDDLSLSASTLLPLTEDFPFWLLLNAKLRVVNTGRFHLALQGAGTFVHVDSDNASAGVLGAAATLCLDDDCYSTLSGYLGAGFARQDQSALPFMAAGSLAYRVAKHVKLLLEADTGFIAGEIDAAADGFLGWYGVRFTSSIIGVDLGFVKPFCDGCEDTGLPLGLPFVSFTYRALR